MDEVSLQSLFGREPDWMVGVDLRAGAASGRPLGVAAYRQAVTTVTSLAEQFAEIEGDRTLSDEGKGRKRARAVRDTAVSLGKVQGHRAKLAKELTQAQKAARPRVAPNDAVSAAIWPKLPEDPNAVLTLYGDAIAASDWATANAIESLPTVFDGRLDAQTLAGLRRERLRVEAPEALAALEVAEDTLATVDGALHTATAHVEETSRDLPDPDDGGDVKVGEDGLRELTPSQFQEATGVAPLPGDLAL